MTARRQLVCQPPLSHLRIGRSPFILMGVQTLTPTLCQLSASTIHGHCGKMSTRPQAGLSGHLLNFPAVQFPSIFHPALDLVLLYAHYGRASFCFVGGEADLDNRQCFFKGNFFS